MNPYPWLAGLLLILAVAFGADHFGHARGVDQQKAADQVLFDGVNKKLADQKTEANAKLRELQDKMLALVVERDKLKTKLETEHAANQKATAGLRDELASTRLRFAAAQAPGPGGSGGGPENTGANATGDTSPTYCVISAEADRDLKALAFDADTLRDDYKLLYDWAHAVK